MENTLKIRFNKEINGETFIIAKDEIKRNVGIEKESELFEKIEGGVIFVYDNEWDDGVEMTHGEDEESAFIQISSDSIVSLMQVYELVESIINRQGE